uniref:Hexosyltransferase n=1 Tax=Naja naja TaxID=35670 RepID=A0A8C6VC36_NAJNA
MPPRWKRSRCTLTQLLFGLLCSLATLLVLSFLASSRHEDPHSLLSQMGSGVGEQFIDTLLQPPPNAFPLSPSPCALTTPWLLVLVASAPGHEARRAAVRRSWGVARVAGGHSVQTVFTVGLPGDVARQAALEREAAEHGDLLQGRFADTYANLTLKTLAMLGWATTRCPTARFLLKADDDVFLNLPALGPAAAYLGRIHWRVAPDRDPSSRHYVPASLYSPSAYPPYCSGTTYVLSGPAAVAVLAAARHLPLFAVEDAFVGLCARRAGLAPRHLALEIRSRSCYRVGPSPGHRQPTLSCGWHPEKSQSVRSHRAISIQCQQETLPQIYRRLGGGRGPWGREASP